jgi:hypothetical protein
MLLIVLVVAMFPQEVISGPLPSARGPFINAAEGSRSDE